MLLWIAVGFLLGSIPFALLLVRWLAGVDVRDYGDGNPGAGNAWRAAGWGLGMTTVIIEVAKGAAPVALAQSWGGISGWALVPVALAPVVGHAFSPWLKFHGGKAIAASFGMWFGLGGWLAPLALAVSMGMVHAVQSVDAWTVVTGFAMHFVFLLVWGAPPWMLICWCCCAAIVLYRQWPELHVPPARRGWTLARRQS